MIRHYLLGFLLVISVLISSLSPTFAAELSGFCNLPEETLVDRPLSFNAEIEKNPKIKLDYSIIYYRNLLKSSWRTVFLKKQTKKNWLATIPGQHISKPGIEIYGVWFDKKGKKHEICHSEDAPGMVLVVDNVKPAAVVAPAPTPPPAEKSAEVADITKDSVDKAVAKTEKKDAEKEIETPEKAEEVTSEDPKDAQKSTDNDPIKGVLVETEFEKEAIEIKPKKETEEFSIYTAETEAKIYSAAKREQDISQSPSAITVITAEDLKNYSAPSFAEALRLVPGMDYMEISHADKNLNVRGFNREGSNKMLTLVDGRSVYIDLLGITFWEALPVTQIDVKRIEVIRGPASTMYGANAFSGVINIYSKQPEDLKGMQYSMIAGPYGTDLSAVVGDVHDRLGYKLSAGYHLLNSYDNMNEKAIESVKANGLIEYQIGRDFAFSISGGAQTGTTEIFALTGPIKATTTLAHAQVNGEWNGLKGQFFWSYLGADLTFDFPVPNFMVADPGWYDSSLIGNAAWHEQRKAQIISVEIQEPDLPVIGAQSHTFDVDLMYSVELGNIDRISLGGNIRFVLLDAPELVDPDSQNNIYSAFLQNELYPWDWFLFNAGIRYDMLDVDEQNTNTGSEVGNIHSFSPRSSLVFIPHKDHSIRISGGLSFRSPAFYESHMKVRLANLAINAPLSNLEFLNTKGLMEDLNREIPMDFAANEELGPEKMYSLELGYGGRFAKQVEFNADFFMNWYRDLILFDGDTDKLFWSLNPFLGDDADPDQYNPFSFNNNVNANNIGFELSTRVRITSWLKGFVNYSFQQIWVTNEEDLKQQYADDKNAFYKQLPTSAKVKAPEPLGEMTNCFFGNTGDKCNDGWDDALYINPDDVELKQITTVHTENPKHKANIGINTHYKGFSANLYGHFVSETERRNFLTRLASAEYLTFSYDDKTDIGSWVRYQGRGPIAVYTKTKEGNTTTYGIDKIDQYFILNYNMSYAFLDGKIEIGVAFFDLLHLPSLWQSTDNHGFDLSDRHYVNYDDRKIGYKTADSISSPRYVQYPRTVLFGNAIGGETIPTRVYFTIRGEL